MKEFAVATEALELLTSREAREYRLIPFEIKGDQLCNIIIIINN